MDLADAFGLFLKTVDYPQDCSSNKLSWVTKLRNAKDILTFLCDNVNEENVLMKDEMIGFKELETKGNQFCTFLVCSAWTVLQECVVCGECICFVWKGGCFTKKKT
jgi:hypothetical protein